MESTMPPQTPEVTMPPVNTPVPEVQPQVVGFPTTDKPESNKKVMTVIIFVIVVLAVIFAGIIIYYFVNSKNDAKPYVIATPITTTESISAPTATPITSDNVDATLDANDQSVEDTLNQADTDLNQVNSNTNASQDTTTGL